MKKLALAIIITMSINATNAQEIKFGAKAGLNLATIKLGNFPSNISNEDKEALKEEHSPGSRESFFAGLMVEINLSEKFSIQPEVIYSSQGGIREYKDTDKPADYFDKDYSEQTGIVRFNNIEKQGVKLDYINFPIILKYKILNELSLEIGPQVGLLLNVTEVVVVNGEDMVKKNSDKDNEAFSSVFSNVDFGLDFGVSYSMNNLNFGARYNLGFKDIITKDLGMTHKNGVIQFSVGYFF